MTAERGSFGIRLPYFPLVHLGVKLRQRIIGGMNLDSGTSKNSCH